MTADELSDFVTTNNILYEFPAVGIAFSVAVLVGFVLVIFNCAKKEEKKTWKDDSIYGHGVVDRAQYRSPTGDVKGSSQPAKTPVKEESIYGQGVTIIDEKKRNNGGCDTTKQDHKIQEAEIYGDGVHFQNDAKIKSGLVKASGAGMKTEQSIYGEGVRFKKEDARSNALEKTTDANIPTIYVNSGGGAEPSDDNSTYTELARTQVGSAMYAKIIKPGGKEGAKATNMTEWTQSEHDDGTLTLETDDAYSVIEEVKIPHRVPPSRPPPVLEKASDSKVLPDGPFSKNKNEREKGAKFVYEVVEPFKSHNNKNVNKVLKRDDDGDDNAVHPKIFQTYDPSRRSKSEQYSQIKLTDARDRKLSSPFPATVYEDDDVFYGSLSNDSVTLASPEGIYDKLKHPAFPV